MRSEYTYTDTRARVHTLPSSSHPSRNCLAFPFLTPLPLSLSPSYPSLCSHSRNQMNALIRQDPSVFLEYLRPSCLQYLLFLAMFAVQSVQRKDAIHWFQSWTPGSNSM